VFSTKRSRLRVGTKCLRAQRREKAVPRPAHSAALVTALQIFPTRHARYSNHVNHVNLVKKTYHAFLVKVGMAKRERGRLRLQQRVVRKADAHIPLGNSTVHQNRTRPFTGRAGRPRYLCIRIKHAPNSHTSLSLALTDHTRVLQNPSWHGRPAHGANTGKMPVPHPSWHGRPAHERAARFCKSLTHISD